MLIRILPFLFIFLGCVGRGGHIDVDPISNDIYEIMCTGNDKRNRCLEEIPYLCKGRSFKIQHESNTQTKEWVTNYSGTNVYGSKEHVDAIVMLIKCKKK
ncbi:MAG: hypothetical protein OCD01_11815 [Fibrobacterales bacterium]